MNASVAIQVLPNVNSTQEVVAIVDRVIEYIQSTGVKYEVGAFETTIEGDFDQLMAIVKESHLIAIEAGCGRVSSYIKVVYAPAGSILTIDEKVTKHRV